MRLHPFPGAAAAALALLLAAGPAAAAGTQAPAEPPVPRHVYTGMWTVHFRDWERGIDANHLIGLSWGRVYGGTFINSWERRAFSAGVQGSFGEWRAGPGRVGLGWRVGFVTGYDERFASVAAKTPVLPFAQPLLTVGGTRTAVEFSWSGVVASAAVRTRF
jgi:hypothetical protein